MGKNWLAFAMFDCIYKFAFFMFAHLDDIERRRKCVCVILGSCHFGKHLDAPSFDASSHSNWCLDLFENQKKREQKVAPDDDEQIDGNGRWNSESEHRLRWQLAEIKFGQRSWNSNDRCWNLQATYKPMIRIQAKVTKLHLVKSDSVPCK